MALVTAVVGVRSLAWECLRAEDTTKKKKSFKKEKKERWHVEKVSLQGVACAKALRWGGGKVPSGH